MILFVAGSFLKVAKKVCLCTPRFEFPLPLKDTAAAATECSGHDIVHRQRALFYSRNHEMSPQLRNCDSIFDNFRLNSALTDWILRQVQH